jgi:hypothetical protein
MEEKVEEFKEYWRKHNNFISMDLEDYEIAEYIERYGSIEMAVDGATDYLLSRGLATDVKE